MPNLAAGIKIGRLLIGQNRILDHGFEGTFRGPDIAEIASPQSGSFIKVLKPQ